MTAAFFNALKHGGPNSCSSNSSYIKISRNTSADHRKTVQVFDTYNQIYRERVFSSNRDIVRILKEAGGCQGGGLLDVDAWALVVSAKSRRSVVKSLLLL
jgi:hypothetical protein